jgi:hypothetical protein
MHMRVKRLKPNPQPIIDISVIIPVGAIRHDTIKSQVAFKWEGFSEQDAGFNFFKRDLSNGILPPIKAVPETQVRS